VTHTLAVYGGSFDPPHIAHSLVCAYVLSAYAIDGVLVVPTHQHPFDKPLAPFAHRLKMCELALRDLRRVEISAIEAELGGASYTLRTLELLALRRPGVRLRLVIGSDLLDETAAWHGFERIRELAPPIVVARAGSKHATPDMPAIPDISSTEVRRRLRLGLSTEGLLDPQVSAYAQAHGLYRAEPG
jgi:nicotinate-nucleotide adenylyltransferase